MAKWALVRVDNRMIHGQVAAGWIGKSNAENIVVIDTETAHNELRKKGLQSTGRMDSVCGVPCLCSKISEPLITVSRLDLILSPCRLAVRERGRELFRLKERLP